MAGADGASASEAASDTTTGTATDTSLDDGVALVTGGTDGIGRERAARTE